MGEVPLYRQNPVRRDGDAARRLLPRELYHPHPRPGKRTSVSLESIHIYIYLYIHTCPSHLNPFHLILAELGESLACDRERVVAYEKTC